MSEFQHVLEVTADSIDTLYHARLTRMPLSNLPTEMLGGMAFDLGMVVRIIDHELNRRARD